MRSFLAKIAATLAALAFAVTLAASAFAASEFEGEWQVNFQERLIQDPDLTVPTNS